MIKKPRVGRFNERGDTIVEVLLSLAVLGVVLGAGYVVTNRSIIANAVAQERLQAVKLAESQFERIKVLAVTNPDILDKTNICFPKQPSNPTQPSVAYTNPQCYVDANDDPIPGTVQPRYSMRVIRDGDAGIPGNTKAGTRFHVVVQWDNVEGRGTDQLDSYYEVYR